MNDYTQPDSKPQNRHHSLYPNTFQHPNLYADRLAYYLTPQENTVLTKAVREILGWQSNETVTRRIALSVFVEGKFKEDMPKTEKNRLCYGCGLSKDAVSRALIALHKYGVLVKSGSHRHPDGQQYTLQFDPSIIDWKGLAVRKENKVRRGKKQLKKARSLNPLAVERKTPANPVQQESDQAGPVRQESNSPVRQESASPVRQEKRNPKKLTRNPITTPPNGTGTSDVTSSDSSDSVVVGLENGLRRLNKHLDKPIYSNKRTDKLSPELVERWAAYLENGGEAPPTKALIGIIGSGQAPPDLPPKVEYVPVENFEL